MQEIAYKECKDREFFDKLEKAIIVKIETEPEKYHFVEMPLVHRLTKDMYSRQITMPVGTWVVSERHVTQNQFIVSQGIISIFSDGKEEIIAAPYHGVTEPGTKRFLYIHPEGGEAIFTTFHPTLLTTVEEIYETLVEKYINPLLEGKYKNNVFVPEKELLTLNNNL